MRQFLARHAAILLAITAAVIFTLWPQLDLMLAARFYVPGAGFPMGQAWWMQLIYVVVAKTGLLAFLWLFLLLVGFHPGVREWVPRRAVTAYLLAALAVGPGLIVNTILKDHWGRPRPVHLMQFGGESTFTPALQPSDQCSRNCAFVSGHAAAGFYPMAGFWVTRRRRWLAGGAVFGLLVGFTRMAMGAHFLSDVLFAGLIVYFTCWLLSLVFLRSHAAPSPKTDIGDLANASKV